MHDLCIIKRSTVFRAITKFQDIFFTFSWHQQQRHALVQEEEDNTE